MSHGSLYSDLDDARPIGRARLLNLYSRCYPGLDLDRWYPVLPGGGPYGVYLDLGEGLPPRFISGSHCDRTEVRACGVEYIMSTWHAEFMHIDSPLAWAIPPLV